MPPMVIPMASRTVSASPRNARGMLLGGLGWTPRGGQREDGGQGDAGGEREARQGGMLQQHRADAGLQGDGDGKSGAEFAKEIALR